MIQFLLDLTVYNPMLRLKLKTRTAYTTPNIILAGCMLIIVLSEFGRFFIFLQAKWLDAYLPSDVIFPDNGLIPKGIGCGWGYSNSMWEELAYAASAWAMAGALGICAAYLLLDLSRAILPIGSQKNSLHMDLLATPVRSVQILIANHDWPYFKAGLVLAVGCILRALPSRVNVFMGDMIGLNRYLGVPTIFGQLIVDPDLSLSLWSVATWCFIFAAHRTIFVCKFSRAGFFSSRLFLAWLVWGAVFCMLHSFEITHSQGYLNISRYSLMSTNWELGLAIASALILAVGAFWTHVPILGEAGYVSRSRHAKSRVRPAHS